MMIETINPPEVQAPKTWQGEYAAKAHGYNERQGNYTYQVQIGTEAVEYSADLFFEEVKRHAEYMSLLCTGSLAAAELPLIRKASAVILAKLRGVTPNIAYRFHQDKMKAMVEDLVEDHEPDIQEDFYSIREMRELQALMLPEMFS